MDLKSRLNRLEGATPQKRTARTLVLLYDAPEPEDVRPDDVIIRVSDEQARALVWRIIRGEGT